MTLHDPLDKLKNLAEYGEQQATPMSVERVRTLGRRRRQRRQLAGVAAGVLVVAIGGGTLIAQTGVLSTTTTPNPVATPSVASPTPRPLRTISAANLLRTTDIETQTQEQRVLVIPSGRGRAADRSSACIPDVGLAGLGATGMVQRNFAYKVPGGPTSPEPSIYTQALQFAEPDKAKAALATYRGWIDDCRATLERRSYTVINSEGATWVDVESSDQVDSVFALAPLYREPGDTSDSGYFESVGLTRVDDRLMVTVDLIYGQDASYSTKPDGDPANGMLPHPQFALTKAAMQRLAG